MITEKINQLFEHPYYILMKNWDIGYQIQVDERKCDGKCNKWLGTWINIIVPTFIKEETRKESLNSQRHLRAGWIKILLLK